MMKLAALVTAGIVAATGTVMVVAGAIGDGDDCITPATTPTPPQQQAPVPGDDTDADTPPDVDIRALRASGGAFIAAPADDTGTDTAPPTGGIIAAGSDTLDGAVTLSGSGVLCGNGITGPGGSGWSAGNIIADDVFYDSAAMDAAGIGAFLADKGSGCTANCLKDVRLDTVSVPADSYCSGYNGGTDQPIAAVFADVSRACGINPQVLLVMLEKESSLVTASNPAASRYNAAFGYACPDSGPGGSAACDGGLAGLWAQTWGFAHQLAKYRVDIPSGAFGRYRPGETVDVLWNVAESGCGSAPVTIANVATASLYTYTPYQPNQAAIAAYPRTGDKCSSYGNRNFFFLFQDWFGPTGGGAPVGDALDNSDVPLGPLAVQVSGVTVAIPDVDTVPEALIGAQVAAPSQQVARAIASGMTYLGTPYSWGGGNANGPALGICAGGPAANDCNIVGFDCSGLTSYVAGQFGAHLPRYSGDQRNRSYAVDWSKALPGDIVGYSGHVAIYLGELDSVSYMLEAPESGRDIQISPVRSGADSVVYRYWGADV